MSLIEDIKVSTRESVQINTSSHTCILSKVLLLEKKFNFPVIRLIKCCVKAKATLTYVRGYIVRRLADLA